MAVCSVRSVSARSRAGRLADAQQPISHDGDQAASLSPLEAVVGGRVGLFPGDALDLVPPGRLIDSVHDSEEVAIAFDSVPIGIGDGLLELRRFCSGRYRVSGCPDLKNPLVAVEMLPVPSD